MPQKTQFPNLKTMSVNSQIISTFHSDHAKFSENLTQSKPLVQLNHQKQGQNHTKTQYVLGGEFNKKRLTDVLRIFLNGLLTVLNIINERL